MALPSLTAARPRLLLDLEALVAWVVRDQKADRDRAALHTVEAAAQFAIRTRRRMGGSDYPGGWGVDSCARVAEIGGLGTRIDGGGQTRGVAPRLHPDAERVMDAINRLPGRQRGLVLHHARFGRPEWDLGPQRLKAEPNDNPQGGGRRHKVLGAWERMPSRSEIARAMMARGIRIVDDYGRPKIQTADRGFSFQTLDDGTREFLCRWSPLQLVPSDADIGEARRLYADWHAGMMALLAGLLGVDLRDHRLRGFSAPARPWE